MFSIELPYSGRSFIIKKLAFKHIVEIARIQQDGTVTDLIRYLEKHYKTQDLNVIDKFYVMIKGRELFIDEAFSMISKDSEQVKINASIILDKIKDNTRVLFKKITIENLVFTFDLPINFIIERRSSIFEECIHEIAVDDITIPFSKLDSKDKEVILENLSPSIFNVIKKYVESLDATFTLFEGNALLGITPIRINFLSEDPVNIIDSLYGDYSLPSCREIIYHLSNKIGENTLFNSTMPDILFFIKELTEENKKSSRNSIPTI